MRAFLILVSIIVGGAAFADGFAQKNLSKIKLRLGDFQGGQLEASQEPDRITIACSLCKELIGVDVQLGVSRDGTEGRFRSGETTIEDMRAICKQRDPNCKLDRADVGGAVGWVTQYQFGDSPASTAVLFRDGDVLTIRVFSDKARTTKKNMATALRQIAPQIVGSK